MARDWPDLFIVDGVDPAAAGDPEPGEASGGRFRRLRESLRRTRQALTSEIQATLFEELDERTWERLEEALIYADVGAQTTAKVVGDLEREATGVGQLELGAERAGAGFVKGPPEADPGSVAYEAIAEARRDGADVVIVDTAGRLHTQDDLMAELEKVSRVITKQIPDAPHETLLTIDATTGQNGLRQARLFSEAVDVSGLVLTKLDGTAKGGIALAIAHELKIPVKLIGVGEKLEDLRPFDAAEFARALIAA